MGGINACTEYLRTLSRWCWNKRLK